MQPDQTNQPTEYTCCLRRQDLRFFDLLMLVWEEIRNKHSPPRALSTEGNPLLFSPQLMRNHFLLPFLRSTFYFFALVQYY